MRFSRDYASVEAIRDDESPLPLGPRDRVHGAVRKIFPSVDFSDPVWGSWYSEIGSIEFNLGKEDPVRGIMMHVRAEAAVVEAIVELCRQNQWHAVDCSEGEFVRTQGASKPVEDWHDFLDRVVEG